ncbi:hypothetical protein [Paraburkholderia sediminicola]|uniref:hypothetical protein n=1 Tax=Paraburkholderia sediminicola TaxID=458836 RepID=UPI0038B94758
MLKNEHFKAHELENLANALSKWPKNKLSRQVCEKIARRLCNENDSLKKEHFNATDLANAFSTWPESNDCGNGLAAIARFRGQDGHRVVGPAGRLAPLANASPPVAMMPHDDVAPHDDVSPQALMVDQSGTAGQLSATGAEVEQAEVRSLSMISRALANVWLYLTSWVPWPMRN